MGLRKKQSLMDQASDYVEELIPQIESAMASARDKALPLLNDARDKAAPVIADARERTAPVIADARERTAPVIADARAKAAPVIAGGAAYAADKAATATALAAEKASAASDLAAAKAAEVNAEKQKGGKLKKLFIIGGLLAIGSLVFKRMKGDAASDNWQTSYTPSPAPSPSSAPSSAPSGSTRPTPVADDSGASSPDEALADATDEPRPPSTPDDPAEVVTLDEEAASKASKKA